MIENTGSRIALISSSGGKDSVLALWHARRQGIEVRTMLTMFEENGERSRSHGVPRALVERQSEAMGLNLVGPCASWRSYETVFVEALRELKAAGHQLAVFGDIDLDAHREWEERVCLTAGLQPCLPLWHRDRRELSLETLALGFRAIVVCTDSRFLSDDFCGREFDRSFIEDLPANVDPCGENGEFHTFVHDGPLFREPLRIRVQGKREYRAPPEYGGTRYCFADLAAA